jgi:hypothetical protein
MGNTFLAFIKLKITLLYVYMPIPIAITALQPLEEGTL